VEYCFLVHSFLLALIVVAFLFFGMLACLEIGRELGQRARAKGLDAGAEGVGVVDSAVFALLGLLIAFTFSGAATRFDMRRQLLVRETNAIGTAYLRVDLLPTAAQPKLRESFRNYVDARLAFYQKLPDMDAAALETARYTTLQRDIWTQEVAACQQSSSPAVMSLAISSTNDMIDITTTRGVALRTHPPAVIYVMLLLMALAASLLAGFGLSGSKQRAVLHTIGFALLMSVALYVILDLEFPRMGLVRIDAADQLLVELRTSMR
jgi:hypothetical protein